MTLVLLEGEDGSLATIKDAFALMDSYDETPILSDLPNEIHSLSDSGRVKWSLQERNREQNFRRCRQERPQLQMQTQRPTRCLSRWRGSASSVASPEALRAPSCVTSEILQQQLEAKLLDPSLHDSSSSEEKWSESIQYASERSMETVSLASSQSKLSSKASSVVYCSPVTLQRDHATLREEIMVLMDNMYHEAKEAVDGAAASMPAFSCHYNVRLNPKEGPTIQLTSETPLDCSLDSARDLLAAMFALTDSSQTSLKTRRTGVKRTNTEGERAKKFTVDLGGSRAKECLDDVGLLRRHTEENCELVIWAAISFHHSGKISFRESSWMAATRSAPSASVIHVNYRLRSEKAEACSHIDGEHINQVRDHALGAMGAKMKADHRMLQRKMLIETGREDLASFIA